MVVIFIIGLLATVVMINVLPSQDKAMVTKARADIATLESALEQYRLDNLTYPASGDGLNALVTAPPALAQPERHRRRRHIRKLPAHPWGPPYPYPAPGPHRAAFRRWVLGTDPPPRGPHHTTHNH